MSAPFFDKSGTATIFPGDSAIYKKKDGKHQRVFVRRVYMFPEEQGVFTPYAEVQWLGVINAIPCNQLIKCVRYMSDDYASVAALEYTQFPNANSGVLVWSVKLSKFIHAIVKALDDDICLIEYKGVTYEAPTADVYVRIKRRDEI